MKIKDLFRGDIERPIEEVIHVDLSDEEIVAHEINEHVVTGNIRGHLEELVDLYGETALNTSCTSSTLPTSRTPTQGPGEKGDFTKHSERNARGLG